MKKLISNLCFIALLLVFSDQIYAQGSSSSKSSSESQKTQNWFIEPNAGVWIASSFNQNHRPIAPIFGAEVGKRVFEHEYFNADALLNINATTHRLRPQYQDARTWVMLFELGGRFATNKILSRGEAFVQLTFGLVDEISSVKALHKGPQFAFSQTWALGYTFPNPVIGGKFSVRWDAVYSRENSDRSIFWTAPKASLRYYF
jgi:hypothetical protein